MDIEVLRNYCLSLPGVTEDIKWGNDLCFCVGEKMFIVTNPDGFPVSASFKTTDELFTELTAREGIIPAPYLARNKWVHVDDISRISKKEWTALIDKSYSLIFSKLPVKLKKQISGA